MIDNAGCASNANNALRLWLNTTPTVAGIYPLKGGEFFFQGATTDYSPDANMVFRITTLGVQGRLVEGIFSGTASYKDPQNITHTITITNGVFKVLRKN